MLTYLATWYRVNVRISGKLQFVQSQDFATLMETSIPSPVSRQIVRLQQIVCHCMILEVSTESN